ncbi:MAG: metal-dependent hydrolase [Lamprobacter sp.]|uniref:metal-dependent hydrolase n=1 Tax=Lamprobacter sp. TaxID=3100796 RepID=UPI002B25C6A2|nr:metal-dependent hydrolase [Lamprobacter sp.]MEA3640917.1 metal-dependent hydrolase [Lamprobacter sp.]
MANFRAHLTGGALISGVAAFASYGEGLSSSAETQALFVLGTAASLLPDIDADDSTPVRALFNSVGIMLGFILAFRIDDLVPMEVAVLEQIAVWIAVSLFVAFPLRWGFARLTVHRGVWHTLLMAIVLALATTVAADLWLAVEPLLAWLAGGFVLLGYLTHLTLDEIASVDLLGRRVKRSFGTALKPLSLRAWPWSLLLIGLAVLLIGLTPDPAPLLAGVGQLGLSTEPLTAHWPRW